MSKRAQPYDRDKAIAAAQEIFWRKGYHATSLKDLEGALQMKPGSIYAAFKSKENLFHLALERYVTEGKSYLDGVLAETGSPLQTLTFHMKSFGQASGEGPANRSCMVVKTLLDTTEDDGHLAKTARDLMDGMRDEFAALFEQAKAQGEISARADVGALAAQYQSMVTALRIEAHRGTPPEDIAKLADAFAGGLIPKAA